MKKGFLLLIIFSAFFSCKKKDTTPQGDNEIWLLYKRFNPTVKEIKRGTTLSFMNKDNANHSITETTGKFDSGKIKPGGQYDYTFNDSLSLTVYCHYHPDNLQEQLYITVK